MRVNANVVDGRLALDQFRAELLQTVGRAEVAFELRRVVAEVFRFVSRRDGQVQGTGAVQSQPTLQVRVTFLAVFSVLRVWVAVFIVVSWLG